MTMLLGEATSKPSRYMTVFQGNRAGSFEDGMTIWEWKNIYLKFTEVVFWIIVKSQFEFRECKLRGFILEQWK